MTPIYLDNAATTPTDPRVVEAMLPYFASRYGNPASRTHAFGWEAEEAVQIAREQVAALIGADAKEIVWTSGATEANNLALKGALAAYGNRGDHLVTTRVEHPAVLDAAARLERSGSRVSYLPVDREGRVSPESVAAAIDDGTVLVSVIHGNNETGVIQDLPAISKVCREKKVLFHTDATQSVGKVELSVEDLGVDYLSMSGHKFYGPKGVGALYIARRRPRLRLVPSLDGGGHEGGFRSGTLNVPGIVGMGKAATLAAEEMPTESERLRDWLSRLETALVTEKVIRNTPLEGRLPTILNLSFPGVDGDALLLGLREVAVSSGSACASASLEPSHVLLALGRTAAEARGALRLSLGRFNVEEDVERAIVMIRAAVEELCRAQQRLRNES